MSEFDCFDTSGIDSETDYSIDVITNNDSSIVYGLYSKIRGYLFHYNIVKLRYKLLASTWFLATFLGFGYLISGVESILPMNNLLGIFLLSLLSFFGISLLWFLDVVVYHRILGSIFIGSIELEKNNSFLGNTHQDTVGITYIGKTAPVIYDGLFYVVLIAISLIIGETSLFQYLLDSEYSYPKMIIGITAGASLIALALIVETSRDSSESKTFPTNRVLRQTLRHTKIKE